MPGPLRALAVTGERSLTAYLLAVAVWAVTVAVCALLARSGNRGPAETLLRRLTYSPTRLK